MKIIFMSEVDKKCHTKKDSMMKKVRELLKSPGLLKQSQLHKQCVNSGEIKGILWRRKLCIHVCM